MNKVLNGIFQFIVILGVGFCGGYVLAILAKSFTSRAELLVTSFSSCN